jgi:diacylglycerol kinase family enzyme
MVVRSPMMIALLLTLLMLGGADAFVTSLSQRTNLFCRHLASSYEATTQLYSSSIVGGAAAETNSTTSAAVSSSRSANAANDGVSIQIGKTAVILNRNARGVTDWVVETVQEILGDDNNNAVFVTTTAEEAVDAARQIMQHSSNTYQLVVPVGGDGTLTTTIQSMCEAAILNDNNVTTYAQALQKLPLIGYIPLGTGNGVGSVVGCSSQVADIKNRESSWWSRLRRKNRKKQELAAVLQALKEVGVSTTTTSSKIGNATGLDTSIVKLPMMEISSKDMIKQGTQVGELCFFAGVGFDSLMLNDFKEIKAWSKKTGFLTSILSSVTGYCVALVVKTLPKTLFYGKHNIHVRVSTRRPETTLWVDHRRGDFVEECDNEVLFQGETGILAAGTAPYYGGGLRLFPFARMTLDKMQLRLGRIHPATGFWNIPGIFKGSYRETSDQFGVLDFLGTDFDVQVTTGDDGFPLQHSGESVGNVQRFRLRVVEEPVRFVSFLKKR